MLSSILMAFILVATPVLAEVLGSLPSCWQPDPLQPGAQWWRDTTNQNDIAQYYNDIYPYNPRVETVADGVYVVTGIGISNVVALIGQDEWVLIDTTSRPSYVDGSDSYESMSLALLLLRQYINPPPYTSPKRLIALIYTSEDYTHIGGSSILDASNPTVYASADFLTALYDKMPRTEYLIYNLAITGYYLTTEPDGRIGTINTFGKYPFLYYPRVDISAETAINVAGFNIDLIPAESANDADMLVWLPDQHVLVSGDTWSPSFPNIGPLTGNGRSVPDWVNTLNTMISLNPDVMVPTHGPVISSNAEINTILTNYRDAMQYVYDSTQALINQGVSEDDAAAQVQLPEPWSSDPYLQPFVSSIASAIKGIYHPDDWWFNGEPPELASTLTDARRAESMAELSGDINHMLTTSLNAELAANDLASAEGALLMAWATYQAAPDNILAHRIYTQALRKNAFMQRSNQIRNYYLTIALQVESTMPADTTAPAVTINAPVDGAEYYSASVPAAAYTVSDDSDPYPSIDVEGWSNVLGEHTLTVTATDFAGNVGTASVIYWVGPIQVTIDIKPGSDPNSINLGSKGVVPVAVLTTTNFDASTVNPEMILFAGAAPEKWHLEDVDGDGDIDLLFHFATQKLNLTGSSTEATLTGQTAGGQEITGTDSVRIVPVKGKK